MVITDSHGRCTSCWQVLGTSLIHDCRPRYRETMSTDLKDRMEALEARIEQLERRAVYIPPIGVTTNQGFYPI